MNNILNNCDIVKPVHDINLTFFRDQFAKSAEAANYDTPSLIEKLMMSTADIKDGLPLISGCSFGDKRTNRGCLRHNANVISLNVIIGDYDAGIMPIDDARRLLADAGVEGILYTTSSHTDEKPRWRVLCRLSSEQPPEAHAPLLGRLNGVLRGALARESWVLSQSFRFGFLNDADPVWYLTKGDCLDMRTDLDAGAISKPGGAVSHKSEIPSPEERLARDPELLTKMLGQVVSHNDSYQTFVDIGHACKGAGIPFETWADYAQKHEEHTDSIEYLSEKWEGFNPTMAGETAVLRILEDHGIETEDYQKAAAQEAFPADMSEPPERYAGVILHPSAPLEGAREMILRQFSSNGDRTLHHHNGDFYRWRNSHYTQESNETVRAAVYRFLDNASYEKDGEMVPFNPNKSKVANVLEALAAVSQLPSSTRAPCWLDDGDHPDAADILACSNGLLDLPTRRLLPKNPAFFGLNAVNYPFKADAPLPVAWLQFLDSIWPNDQESIDTLQELFGLLLTGDTSHQKAVLIVGPKRCGKGTIARVLTALLGKENVAGPTLSSLSQNFGMAPLIGKPLAIISDARLGNRTDGNVIAERLLSITGEDALGVPRKFKDDWTGRLPTRFLILSNELPRFTDASGALASRFIVLVMARSFYGQEDHRLTDKLVAELPGILLWAMDGRDRLAARKFFKQPTSAMQTVQALEDLGSPIGTFIKDRCVVEPSRRIECDTLYRAWVSWCTAQGRDHPGTVQTFGRDLRAAVTGLDVMRARDSTTDARTRYYQGIDLNVDTDFV